MIWCSTPNPRDQTRAKLCNTLLLVWLALIVVCLYLPPSSYYSWGSFAISFVLSFVWMHNRNIIVLNRDTRQ